MKYLMITLHDSDFYYELDWLGKHLLDRLSDNRSEPFDTGKINFDKLKSVIVNFIISTYILHGEKWYKQYDNCGEDDIWEFHSGIKKQLSNLIHIEVVEDSEIHEQGYELLYVPLCTSNDIYIKGLNYFII
mgnify:CR=1 FL=1